MNESAPKVIACVPSYNAENFIEKTLLSLQNQSYPNFKVLISDDCSTDNTVSVIQSFIEEDDRFQLIQQSRNLGWVDNVNSLMKKSVEMGEYLFIMPHDDQIDPEYIFRLTIVLEKNPSAILAFSDMDCTYLNQKKLTLRYHQIDNCSDSAEQTELLLKFEGYWWTAYRGVTRSSAVKKMIPLKKNWMGTRDYMLDWIWLLKLSLCGEFIRVPEILYSKFYQEKSASIHWKHSNRNFATTYLTCSKILWKWGLPVRDKIRFQSILYLFLVKRMLIDNRYSLANILKYGFGKMKKIFSKSETVFFEKPDR